MSFQQVEILSRVDDQLTSFQDDLKFIDIVPHLVEIKIPSSDFSDRKDINKAISQIQKSGFPTVYNISCVDVSQRKLLINRYREYQVENTLLTRGKDRLNISRFNQTESDTLYLGSSMNDLPGRIKQHLGGGNFRTYSLHLSKWAGNLTYEITLCTYLIRHKQGKKLERPIVELIEQTLWDHYKPVFGKKSGL